MQSGDITSKVNPYFTGIHMITYTNLSTQRNYSYLWQILLTIFHFLYT